MKIVFPRLTSYQKDVYDWLGDCFESGKQAVIKSVRQSGKSFFCLVALIKMAMEHPGSISVMYEPSMTQARNMFRLIKKAVNKYHLVKTANAQTLELEFVNGSMILFKSPRQDSRSFTITGLLILDECAYIDSEEIYTILPLVNAHNAPVLAVSTPFIQDGYYWDLYSLGIDGNSPSIKTFDWSKEKEIERFLTPEKKALYKQIMSRQKFRTEVEGEFLADEGLLFAGIAKCIGEPDENNTIYIGIDFATGKEGDYTVLSAVNGNGHQICLHRTNNLTPSQQVEWLGGLINDLAERYTIKTILAETNSIGTVYIDYLKKKIKHNHLTITDWTTTNSSKQDLVTALQIALENGYVRILDNAVLLNELRRYEAEINVKTKKVSYNGAKGTNDDTVIATMLAYYAYKKSLGTFRYAFG